MNGWYGSRFGIELGTPGGSKRDVMDRYRIKESDAMKSMTDAIWAEWNKILTDRYEKKIDYALKRYELKLR